MDVHVPKEHNKLATQDHNQLASQTPAATIPLSTLLKHYKRTDVQEAMIAAAEDREVAVKYGEKGFGKRPDVLCNPRDILSFAMQGATSFHVSEERWSNPLRLETSMPRQEMDSLRTGWDLILDIDCKELSYSQIACKLLIDALGYHDVSCITVKFSGNHGFHIAVPFEAFPQEVFGTPVSRLFPEGPRRIALYLKEMIRPHLQEKLASAEPDINTIAARAGVDATKLLHPSGELDPFGALAIDTILLSSRHLYRMPYSFNEKSGLVSIPIDPKKVMHFQKEDAQAANLTVKHAFLLPQQASFGQARKLFIQAFDYKIPQEKMERPGIGPEEQKAPFEELAFALQEDLFPPCIKLILAGIADGRKRASFVLVNFLRSVGWEKAKIEERLRTWNTENTHGQLRDQDLLAPLRYHFSKSNPPSKTPGTPSRILPPNCNNSQYYLDIGVCKPDNLCARIKNPAQYSLIKARAMARHGGQKGRVSSGDAYVKEGEEKRGGTRGEEKGEKQKSS